MWNRDRKLKGHEIQALLLECHRAVQESAQAALSMISQPENENSLTYPPGELLNGKEIAALRKLSDDPILQSALRKIMKDVAAYPLFHLFALLDGVGDPQGTIDWSGARLFRSGDEQSPMLHDEFFGSFRAWEENRHLKNPDDTRRIQ